MLCRETRQSLTDMQEFLSILKTEGAIKDGTIDIHQVLDQQRMERMLSRGDSSQIDANAGIDLRFNNVTFGYTADRTVYSASVSSERALLWTGSARCDIGYSCRIECGLRRVIGQRQIDVS